MNSTSPDTTTAQQPNKSDLTRQRILAAAESIFAEVGFAAARLEDVAAAVGIKRASIVYYFRNKQELYDAVEADIFTALQAESERRVAAGSDALERLGLLLDCWLDFWVARPTGARIIVRNSADITPRSTNPVEFSEATLLQLERIIRTGVEAGELRDVDPILALNFLGTSILNYVCLGREQLGSGRAYQPAQPERLQQFREMLQTTMHALVALR